MGGLGGCFLVNCLSPFAGRSNKASGRRRRMWFNVGQSFDLRMLRRKRVWEDGWTVTAVVGEVLRVLLRAQWRRPQVPARVQGGCAEPSPCQLELRVVWPLGTCAPGWCGYCRPRH